MSFTLHESSLFTKHTLVCNYLPARPDADMGYLFMMLAFDCFVFGATLVYAFKASQSSNPRHLLQTVCRDGTIYFFSVFSGHLFWALLLIYGRVRYLLLQPRMHAYPCSANPKSSSIGVSDQPPYPTLRPLISTCFASSTTPLYVHLQSPMLMLVSR